jgi:hypothetical protein
MSKPNNEEKAQVKTILKTELTGQYVEALNKFHSVPELVEVELGDRPEEGVPFLVLHRGKFMTGVFSHGEFNSHFLSYGNSLQYDPPGTNYSGFQKAWKIVNADQIAAELEQSYMDFHKAYALAHGLYSNGQRITADAPLEAFKYRSTVPAMPTLEEEEDW